MRNSFRIGLAFAALLAIAGAADAHAINDIIVCVQEGPFCSWP